MVPQAVTLSRYSYRIDDKALPAGYRTMFLATYLKRRLSLIL